MMAEKKNILRLSDITMQFGGVVAVDNLTMDVNEHEIVALIGPNGAGKTTAFNAITGVYEPTNGAIFFNGEKVIENHPQGKMKKLYAGENNGKYTHRITKTPDQLTKLGMARTFQNIRLFNSMTVFENVLTAKHLRRTSNVFTATLRLNYKEEAMMRKETMELLELVDLSDVKDELATSLPYGKQRKLEIARALATNPTLLLLTILLIEHHMNLVMDISDRIYVIDFGKEIAQGVPAEIQSNQRVIDAYLGVAEDE